jgi:hypothetical protein
MKRLVNIYFLQVKHFAKNSWQNCGTYLDSSHEFVVSNSFRKIYFLLSIFLFVSCDKVVQDVTPPSQPIIPQATTEVFKQMYPDVASFIFKPLEQDKTWQTDFVTPTGKALSLVDYYGEIIDFNLLVGLPKSLPVTIKQYIFSNYPNAQIMMAYDVMKSSTQTDGYKLTIQQNKTTTLNLFFDANNGFLREEKVLPEKVSSINFTSTDQVNFDTKIPAVVKQFMSNNQLKDASVTIYELSNNVSSLVNTIYKIILNFRDRPNGSLLASEITLSNSGVVLQWVSPIESEYSYNVLNNNNLTTDISNYINANYTNWQYDYGVSETGFGQLKTNYATFKNAQKERILLIDNQPEKQDLIVIRSQVVEEKDLPDAVKNTMANSYAGAVFITGVVTFDPYYQATKLGGKTPAYYQIETKQGSDRYALRIANDGKLIVKYRIQ